MKIAGFTIVRNSIKFDYPVTESILSVLPLCDVFYVGVGNSDDATLQLIKSISSEKIKIIESVWDDNLREGGFVLSNETNKIKDLIPPVFNWLFYIQADELVHEKYHKTIAEAIRKYSENKDVDGLLFRYLHFYGTYDYIGDSRKWYRKEIRVIKNIPEIRSYKDAQGFRKNGKKLSVKEIDAQIYHYGWVKSPKAQQAKQLAFHKMWHDDKWVAENVGYEPEFDYSVIDSLKKFEDSHPQVMQARINSCKWKLGFDPMNKKFPPLARILYFIEKYSGWRIGEYKNYKKI